MSRAPSRLPDLAAWRKKSGTSLPAIAKATKISLRYLEAIERGRFDILPPGVYTLSYLRQYARAIQYDADHLVEYYLRVTKPDEITRTIAAQPARTTRLRRWLRTLRAIAFSGGMPQPHD